MPEKSNLSPEYEWLRELKSLWGKRLLDEYGAHGIGIGWKKSNEKKLNKLVLRIYVKLGDSEAASRIPKVIYFTPKGFNEPKAFETQIIEADTFNVE